MTVLGLYSFLTPKVFSLISASLALLFHEGLFPPGDWGFDDAESRDRDAGGSQLNGKEAEGGVQVV